MARAFHFHAPSPRGPGGRAARPAGGYLVLLVLAALAVLWMTGLSTAALLPIDPPR